MPTPSASSRGVLRGLALVGVVALIVWFWRRDRHIEEPPPRAAAPIEPDRGENADGRETRRSPELAPAPAPSTAPDEETEESRYRDRMAKTKQTLLEKTRYPINSRPLAPKTDLLSPHHVEPTFRGLNPDPSKSHKVLVVQNQDRVWLSPAQVAVATIAATSEGVPAVLSFDRSDLTVSIENEAGASVTQSSPIAHPAFADDGVPPDAIAGDGTYSATVALPPDAPPAAVVLTVDATANGESGTLYFNFVGTAPPPAAFTQTARDALEAGSIAIYVGISVQQAGQYDINGRLYDSTGLPLVFMNFTGTLTTESTEVRLLAFGKVILDEGGVPPFTLRDVDGQEMLLGQYPDRAPMADWPGPYSTASYPLTSLSDADYDGEDKQRRINALDKATQEGMQNIHSTGPAHATGPTTH